MKIGERGQVTIPQHHRKRFGLKPATAVEFVAVGGRLVLQKSNARKRKIWEKHYGILKADGLRTDDIMRELRDR